MLQLSLYGRRHTVLDVSCRVRLSSPHLITVNMDKVLQGRAISHTVLAELIMYSRVASSCSVHLLNIMSIG